MIQNIYDNNLYKFICINNVRCLLIQNVNIEVWYVSLNVDVGYTNDPENFYGLAHCLEHVLMNKCKNKNNFNDKIWEFGIQNNAQTWENNTLYYFWCITRGLLLLLDLFLCHFSEPIFEKDIIKNELTAINYEYLKNMNKNSIIINRVKQILWNEKHGFFHFWTGNLETLNKINLFENIKLFFEKYYISDNISIVIYTNNNLDEIIKCLKFNLVKIKNINNDNNKNKEIKYYPISKINIKSIHNLLLNNIWIDEFNDCSSIKNNLL